MNDYSRSYPNIPKLPREEKKENRAVASLFWVGIISIELLIIGLALKGI
jgi:hypothetical protein